MYHHLESYLSYRLPGTLAYSVLSLVSGCGKRTLYSMLSHQCGHFVGEVGIGGVATEALNVV
jgi:hypothetical protein